MKKYKEVKKTYTETEKGGRVNFYQVNLVKDGDGVVGIRRPRHGHIAKEEGGYEVRYNFGSSPRIYRKWFPRKSDALKYLWA